MVLRSVGAAVEMSSMIGHGGGLVIIKLKRVVPVDRWTWELYT